MAKLCSWSLFGWPACFVLWVAIIASSGPSAAAVRHGGLVGQDLLGRDVAPGRSGTLPERRIGIRLAEARDNSIDYRGTYWIDQNVKPPKPGAPRRDRPLTNFINVPDNRIYDDWDRRTFFDRDKRLAPIGEEANRERERQPAIMILRLKF